MPALSQSKLESHLWESANILRGPVDAADFKTYIFPLLFFKRICDVYDEEVQHALEESGGDMINSLDPHQDKSTVEPVLEEETVRVEEARQIAESTGSDVRGWGCLELLRQSDR